MNVHPNSSQSQKPVLRIHVPQVRFGAGPVEPSKLTSGLTQVVDHSYQRIMGSRSSQMIWEDLIGFGLMRGCIDLFRDKLSAKQQSGGQDQTSNQGQLNWAAASERIGRETASIFTDNILGGWLAAGLGWAIFDKTRSKAAALHNKFIDFPTLETFQKELGANENEFLSNLAASQFAQQNRATGEESLRHAWKAGYELPHKENKQQLAEKIQALTVKLSQKLGEDKQGFTYIREKNADGHPVKTVNVHSLLEDVSQFSQHMDKLLKEQAQAKKGQAAKTWRTLAEESLERTLKAKRITIPVGLGLAMLATFSVPFAISGISSKFFGITSYPGELGLRKNQQKKQEAQANAHKGFWESHAPYLTECVKKGNYWPLLATLSPLPLAAGIVNTTKLNKLGLPTIVKSWKEWKHLFDYQKLKPFTAQQQMAALFGLLITARLLNSRTDNEFNERLLDSGVGWGAWIMGTPILNKLAAKALDHYTGTKLTKPGELGLRSRAEIKALAKLGEATPEVMKRTLNSHIWMQVGTTAATMIGLGILIPWGCLKLTQNNEKRKRQLLASQPQPVKSVTPPIVPAQQFHWFKLPNHPASVSVAPQHPNFRHPFYNAANWPLNGRQG